MNFAEDHALTVVMAARGYPGDYARGEAIGLSESDDPRVKVFHAGTRLDGGRLVSNGGRVLNATARAPSLAEARDLAYAGAPGGGLAGRLLPQRHRLAGAGRCAGPALISARRRPSRPRADRPRWRWHR